MHESPKEKLRFWQPRGIAALKGTNPFQLILASVSKSPSQLELIISDEHENKLRIIYDQLCTAEFAVWHFAYDTHGGRPDLWVNDIEKPDNFSEHTPFFFKIIDWSGLDKYRNATIYEDVLDQVEVHLYSTKDEFFIVVSEYEPAIITMGES